MEDPHVKSLKQQIAILRRIGKDKLGVGFWGLVKNSEKFSHEEILFLFARIFPVLGIDHIKEVRTDYPDCICVKDGKEIALELEPVLSASANHKDDLDKCHCIVCWQDDLNLNSDLREQINNHNIEVVELKQIYEGIQIKKRTRSFEYDENDFRKMSVNKLNLINAFISRNTNILTKEEIRNCTGLKGRPLGGIMQFPKNKEWLIRHHPGGWEFNNKYKQKVLEVIKSVGLSTQLSS